MNRTQIEWTDYTWSPVTGCWGPGGTAEKPNRCSYCYAEKMANRFNSQLPGYRPRGGDPFAPRFHSDRLDLPAKVKKSSKIFVCFMADLFGAWVPSAWIEAVLETIRACPQHTFQLLTKNPARLGNYNPFPGNVWVGTTITNQADADERLPWLLRVDAPVRFVSHEPLLGKIFVGDGLWPPIGPHIDWAIIGAMTGPGAVRPDPEWVHNLFMQYSEAGVPVFIKDNIKPVILCERVVQEWPR